MPKSQSLHVETPSPSPSPENGGGGIGTSSNSKLYTTEGLEFQASAPRVWHGMTAGVWLKLMASGGFKISPSRWPMCFSVTAASVANSALRIVEELLNRKRVDAAEVEAPLFIVGHWRSGTTLLHELMVRDEQFSFPTTLQVMAPHHFLSSGWFTRPLMWLTLPKQRPMDAMKMGVDLPQEDEFAICNLGLKSSYLQWAWPNERECEGYLDPENSVDQNWRETFLRFLKRLAVADSRRLVLKSPTHTARIGLLHEMFPQAQFVHITRDPREVIPSMIRLFQRLHYMQALRVPNFEELEDTIFNLFEQMHRLEQRDRGRIPGEQYIDISYEDLVANPVGTVGSIYEHMSLAGFENLRPKLVEYFEATKDYKRNKHELSDALSARIDACCGDYMRQFGYEAAVGA